MFVVVVGGGGGGGGVYVCVCVLGFILFIFWGGGAQLLNG